MAFSSNLQDGILEKLIYKGKKPPAPKTCKSKIKFATAILALIANDPTEESVDLASKILDALKVYLTDIKFPTLDKIILKIMNKGFCDKLILHLNNLNDPEILAALCYVKLKHLFIVDERIFQIYHLLNGEIKNKVSYLFKDFLKQKNYEIPQENIKYEGLSTFSCCADYTQNLSKLKESIETNKLEELSQEAQASISNEEKPICYSFYDDILKCSIHLQSDFGISNLFKTRQWGDFSDFQSFFVKNESFKEISNAIELIKVSRLKSARLILLQLLKRHDFKMKTLVYNLLSLIHMYCLEYHEAIYYINLQLDNSTCYEMHFALNCKFLLERFAEIPSIQPLISLFSENYDVKDKNFVKNHFENKYLIRHFYGESFNRINLFSNVYCTEEILNTFSANIEAQLPDYTVLFIFYNDKNLHIYNVIDKIHFKVLWDEFNNDFDRIMTENQNILSKTVATPDDKKSWWSIRIRLDRELGALINKVKSEIKNEINVQIKNKILFILEDQIAYFPFELVFDRPALRILSKDIFSLIHKIGVFSAFYLLDPANNLPGTRDCISNYFVKKPFTSEFLNGVVGRPLLSTDAKELNRSELFLYFGHGSGKKYFDLDASKPKVLFLFGCSSCKLLTVKNFKSNGYCLRHFKKQRIVLGNLWDVTDKDLDKLTIAILDDFLSGKDLVESVHRNRNICKLKYLNSAAMIIYGTFSEITCKIDYRNQ